MTKEELMHEFGLNYIYKMNLNNKYGVIYPNEQHFLSDGIISDSIEEIRKPNGDLFGTHHFKVITGATWVIDMHQTGSVPDHTIHTNITDWDKVKEELLKSDVLKERAETIKNRLEKVASIDEKTVTGIDELFTVTHFFWDKSEWKGTYSVPHQDIDLRRFFKKNVSITLKVMYNYEFCRIEIYLVGKNPKQPRFFMSAQYI